MVGTRRISPRLALALCVGLWVSRSPVGGQECPGTLEINDMGLEGVLEEGLARLIAPVAAVVGVSIGGVGEWRAARGHSNLQSVPPVEASPDERSRVGSITKTFVAAVVLQLDQEGALDLDDPIEKWVPGYFDDKGVTLRHLLAHTSGVYNYTREPSVLVGGRTPMTPDQIVRIAVAQPLDFPPGTRWSYSNTGYILLGMAIEAATGSSWGEQVRTRLLDPLGLDDTFADGEEDVDGDIIRGYEGSTGNWTDTTYSIHPSRAWAAGSMVSDTDDLIRWLGALLEGDVLDAEHREMMISPSLQSLSALAGAGVYDSGYGLGLVAERADDLGVIYGHTGGIPPFASIASFFAQHDLAEVMLFNHYSSGLPENPPSVRAIEYCLEEGCAIRDCNRNGIPDDCDISSGTSEDCNGNGTPDECEVSAGKPGFEERFAVDLGRGSSMAETADLDADGDLDLVVLSSSTGKLTLALQGDGGSFSRGATLDTGRGPRDVLCADLNGDAAVDLAVANMSSDTVSVFLNDGRGMFTRTGDFSAGDGPRAVASLDVDGDGHQDLALANRSSDEVSLLLGRGDGTFDQAPSRATGSRPVDVAAEDLDGDGDDDLAVLCEGSDTVQVLLVDGDGEITSADHETGTRPIAFTLADLDADGDLDMAIVLASSALLSVLENDGSGVFTRGPGVSAGPVRPRAVRAADLNGDGNADLAVLGLTRDYLVVRSNAGDGTFELPLTYDFDETLGSLVVGDLDGNGLDDLGGTAGNSIVVRVNSAKPSDFRDCNGNGLPDDCDIEAGILGDVNANGVPDSCEPSPRFARGDANVDGTVDISDASSTLGSLFLVLEDPPCEDASDANDDGKVDISDAIATLGVLFLGQGVIPFPGMRDCGIDPTDDDLDCRVPPRNCR